MNAAAGNDHELETIGSTDAAAEGGGMGGFMLNDSREIMKDISSMLFGDIPGNKNGAIDLRVEVYPNCDDDSDDGEFTVISSKTPFILKPDKMIQEKYLLTQISPISALEIDSDDEEVDSETMNRASKHLSRPANEGGPRIFIG